MWKIILLIVYGTRKDRIVPRFDISGIGYIILVNIVASRFVSCRHYVAIIYYNVHANDVCACVCDRACECRCDRQRLLAGSMALHKTLQQDKTKQNITQNCYIISL